MKTTATCLAILLLSIYSPCQSDPIVFTPIYVDSGNVTVTIAYQVAVSINGVVGDVCANGVTNELALLLCRETTLGDYLNTYSFLPFNGTVTTQYQSYSLNSAKYTDFSCPSGILSCNNSATSVSSCASYGGLLQIKCTLTTPECLPGQVQFNDYVNTSIGSSYYLSGHPTVCVAGTFLPICNDNSLGVLESLTVCAYNGLVGGYFGTPPGVTVPSLTNLRDNNTVVTSYNCSSIFNCTTGTIMGTCGASGYATVTCHKVCDEESDDNIVLFNQYTSVVNGTSYTIGIPQFCSAGTYARVCNDGSNSPEIATYLCNSLNYLFGDIRPFNSSLRSGSPQGIIYYNNFICNSSGCFPALSGYDVFPSDPQCYRGELDLVIQCYGGRACPGSGLSLYSNVTTVVNGNELITGVPVNCLNGFYAALCNDGTLSPFTGLFACSLLGYQNGAVIQPNNATFNGKAPEGSIYYTDFTCPLTATSIDNCTATPATNPQCLSGNMDLVLQCTRAYVSTTASVVILTTATSSSIPITTSIISTASTSATTGSAMSSTSVVTPYSTATSNSNTDVIVGVTVGLVLPLIIGTAVIVTVLVAIFLYMRHSSDKKYYGSKDPVTLKSVS